MGGSERPARVEQDARDAAGMARATHAPLVVKLGGRALEAPDAPHELAAEVASLPGDVVIVHGGGAEVSEWCARLGLPRRFHDGLRVTDSATLEVVTAVLCGLANKRLVAALRAAGVDAVGLSAVDGGIVEAATHTQAGVLGAVGQVVRVHPALLDTLRRDGRTPVLASVAAHGSALLNLNADDLACALAAALGAADLVLLSDAPGVVLNGAVALHLGPAGLERALGHADVRDGMVPKLRASRDAIAAGVRRVHVAAWSGPGTLRACLDGATRGTRIDTEPDLDPAPLEATS